MASWRLKLCFVALLAIFLQQFFVKHLTQLPHPYEQIPIQTISPERVARLHRGLTYAKSSEWQQLIEEKGVSFVVGENTRVLFEGEVLGAESVAIRPADEVLDREGREPLVVANEQLAMLDKFGFLHLATIDGHKRIEPSAGHHRVYLGPGRPLGFHFIDRHTLILCDSLKGLLKVTLHDTADCVDASKKNCNDAYPNAEATTIEILSNMVPKSIATAKSKEPSADVAAATADDDGEYEPLQYANDLDVDPTTGVIYFSSSTGGNATVAFNGDANHYDTMRSYLLNLYAGDVSGRLLKYDPRSRKTSVVLDKLWYANGVALSKDAEFVLVVETTGLRVLRKYLKRQNNRKSSDQQDKDFSPTGQVDEFIGGLPGFPDGITRATDNTGFYISLVAPVSPLMKFIETKTARGFMSILQFQLDVSKYFIKQWGCVLKVDNNGIVQEVFIDPTGEKIRTVSAVTEFFRSGSGGDDLEQQEEERTTVLFFLGNLGGTSVSVFSPSS